MSLAEILFCNFLSAVLLESLVIPTFETCCISGFPLISELAADLVLVWTEKLSCFRHGMLSELLPIFLFELTTLSVAVTLGLV